MKNKKRVWVKNPGFEKAVSQASEQDTSTVARAPRRLVGRPRNPEFNPRVSTTVSLKMSLLKKLNDEANKREQSVSRTIEDRLEASFQ